MIHKLSNMSGYRNQLPKSIDFLYTNNRECRGDPVHTPIQNSLKNIVINLIKEIKGIYNKNTKPLKKERERH